MFAFFVIPAFLAVAALSIWIYSQSNGFGTGELIPRTRVLLNVAGFLIAVTLTLFVVWAVPKSHNSEWGQFITQTCVTILGPLVFGVTLLIIQSLTYSLRPYLAAVAAGALLASIPTPFIVPLVSLAHKITQEGSAFDSLCKNAFVEIIEHVGQVKSVAFLTDSFVSSPEYDQLTITSNSFSSRLLSQSLLEFVERPATFDGGLKGKAKYERVTTNGQRVLMSKNHVENTKFAYEPIEEITAEYIVIPKSIHIDNGQESGLAGTRIEIYRRADDKLISRAQYFWSYKINRFCPVKPHEGISMFIYMFIAESLNVVNPESVKAALPNTASHP